MGEQLVRLLNSDLRAIVAALRSKRLRAPFSTINVGRILPGAAGQAAADELQRLIEHGFSEVFLLRAADLPA